MRKSKPESTAKATALMVRLDSESKTAIADAARLRRVSISDYVRAVIVPQARREIASATERTIQLSPEEQLAFWQALHQPIKLTPKQKRLASLLRGER